MHPRYSALVLAVLACALPAVAESRPPLLVADYSTKRIALVDGSGKITWEHPIQDLHDLHYLANGHVLFQTDMTHLLEVDPQSNKTVWQYDAGKSNGNAGKPVQVHAFQRLPDGLTMIAESGPARIIEVDAAGKLVHQVKLKVDHPDPHRDTRLARKLDNGHYLVCHEADGAVREYDREGKVVWEYDVPMFGRKPAGGHGPEAFGNSVFGALRLANGNTLVATGNGHSVLEVNPEGKILWQVNQDDLPGIKLAWVTTLQQLPGGEIAVGNCHAGPDNPQVIAITRDKKVVWTFKDFKNFGNATSNSQVLLKGPAAR